jgi:hypothetical protein
VIARQFGHPIGHDRQSRAIEARDRLVTLYVRLNPSARPPGSRYRRPAGAHCQGVVQRGQVSQFPI